MNTTMDSSLTTCVIAYETVLGLSFSISKLRELDVIIVKCSLSLKCDGLRNKRVVTDC